ncbi:hypothetical protein CSR02_14495 [Acetobacter pomorum]|uniref:Type IV secretion protein DotI n=1 Tax=Acetobacter pomorum TaxID=65959 RepID=A0A2G4RAP4_9PROT|nr:DotI/IcmL/TraM family protein [Acetobacter pomorum]PHY92835.1 hypothetical protein CSR02_14495 [Acetobacter pomorum]GBR51691.1 putative IcmL protein [Acetobacter pomorum DSM 11825]
MSESKKTKQARGKRPKSTSKAAEWARSTLATIMSRNYGDTTALINVTRIAVAEAGVILALIGALVYTSTRPPVMHYFATDPRGKITPLVPLDQPIMTKDALYQWVTSAVISLYTKDYVHWRDQLNSDQENFSLAGWKSFRKDYEKHFIEPVIENNYITSAVPTKAVVLVDRGVRDGRYAYNLQLGITVTFASGIHERSSSQNYIVSVLVVRESDTENENGRGLAIAQIVTQ